MAVGRKLYGSLTEPKTMHGSSQNLKDMFNQRGSRADYILRSVWLP